MNRLSAVLVVIVSALAVALSLAPVAQSRPAAPSRPAARSGPLLAVGGAVDGLVHAFDDSPLSGVSVTARWVAGGAPQQAGPISTDTNGHYSLAPMSDSDGNTGLVAAVVVPPELWGDEWIADHLDFHSTGTQQIDLRPARLTFVASRSASSWGTWQSVIVRVHSSTGQAFTRAAAASGPASGYAWVMPSSVDLAVAKYAANEEAEYRLPSPQPIAVAGADLNVQLQFNEDAAYRYWVVSPVGASGKPGTSVTLKYQGWPSGTRGEFVGVNEALGGPSLVSLGSVISSDTGVHAVTFKVPLSATPGWFYYFRMYRPDAEKFVPHWIDLTTTFQVCTLKSSKGSIAAGGSIRLSGVVPVLRTGGATTGTPTTVTIFRRTTKAGQPTNWAKPAGWTKVTTLKTNDKGAYRTKDLRPGRATWYVARYDGNVRYHRAFTSVVMVGVK
jgi:hypothetical protein